MPLLFNPFNFIALRLTLQNRMRWCGLDSSGSG